MAVLPVRSCMFLCESEDTRGLTFWLDRDGPVHIAYPRSAYSSFFGRVKNDRSVTCLILRSSLGSAVSFSIYFKLEVKAPFPSRIVKTREGSLPITWRMPTRTILANITNAHLLGNGYRLLRDVVLLLLGRHVGGARLLVTNARGVLEVTAAGSVGALKDDETKQSGAKLCDTSRPAKQDVRFQQRRWTSTSSASQTQNGSSKWTSRFNTVRASPTP